MSDSLRVIDPEPLPTFHVIWEIAKFRRRIGLTQTEVAKRMGVKQPFVAKLESGAEDPRLTTVARYANAVGLRLSIDRDDRP